MFKVPCEKESRSYLRPPSRILSRAISAALAWIVYSAPHLAYHVFNLDVVSSGDRPAEIAALAIPILLAAFVIVAAARNPAEKTG